MQLTQPLQPPARPEGAWGVKELQIAAETSAGGRMGAGWGWGFPAHTSAAAAAAGQQGPNMGAPHPPPSTGASKG